MSITKTKIPVTITFRLILFSLALLSFETLDQKAEASDSADDFSTIEHQIGSDLKFINTSKAKLLTKSKNWLVIRESKPNQHYVCHAVTHPVKTEFFTDERSTASLIVTYLNPKMYTISVYSGFIMKTKQNTILTIDEVQYSLPYNRLSFATTTSSEQDIKIINLMLTTSQYVKIKSNSYEQKIAVDYYSLDGFRNALIYMEKNCTKSGK